MRLRAAPPPARGVVYRLSATVRSVLLLTAAALLTTAVLFPELVLGRGLPLSNEYGLSDLLDVNLPLRAWTAAQLRSGHLPVWCPGAFGGAPLFSIPEAVPAYPFSTLFYLAFSPVRATAWSLLLHLVLAGTGAGMLVRRLGASKGGQVLAAAVTAGGLWLPEHFRQMNLLQAAAWVPWAWLAVERWLEEPSWCRAAQLGLCGGMLALAGHAQILHHAVVALGLWTVYRLLTGPVAFRRGGSDLLRRGATLLLAAGLALLIAAPALLPVAELAGMAIRGDNARFQRLFPSHPRFLLTLLHPGLCGDPTHGPLGHGVIWWEEALYVGLAPLVLAAGWLALGWRRADERGRWGGLVLVGGAGLTLAYAHALGPLALIARLVPGGGQFRFPERYLWFTTLALIAAAALGWTEIEHRISRRAAAAARVRRWGPVLVFLLAVIDLRLTVVPLCPVADPAPQLARPAVLDVPDVARVPPGVERWSQRFATYTRRRLSRAAMVAARGWTGPQEPYGAMRAGMVGEYGMLWGWSTIQGYLGVVPRWAALATADQQTMGVAAELEDRDGNPLPPDRLRLWAAWTGILGARWVASAVPLRHPSLRPAGVAHTPMGWDLHVYENRLWAGPAWIGHRVAVIPEERQLLRYLAFRPPSEDRTVVVQAPLPGPAEPLPPGARSSLTLRGDLTAGRLHLSGEAGAPGVAVLCLNWHPRWRVERDGRPLPTARVNLTQVGVPVARGPVQLELHFDDRLEKCCLIACLLGLISTAALLLAACRRPPAPGLQDPHAPSQPEPAAAGNR